MMHQGRGNRHKGRTMTGMTRIAFLAALALVACAPRPDVARPLTDDLARETVVRSGETPPKDPEGACWASESLPAVYQTVTQQTLVSPEVRDGEGNVVSPASYRSVSKLSQINPARDIWFRTPCPQEMSLSFVATLQRALKARGYYMAEVTGTLDAATSEALRRYQAERGLDSAQLSLAAAKGLGLATTALDEL
jgi:hypothetical protein